MSAGSQSTNPSVCVNEAHFTSTQARKWNWSHHRGLTGIAATLKSIEEESSIFLDRPAHGNSKNVSNQGRTWNAFASFGIDAAIVKEVVGRSHCVAVELIERAMDFIRATLGD